MVESIASATPLDTTLWMLAIRRLMAAAAALPLNTTSAEMCRPLLAVGCLHIPTGTLASLVVSFWVPLLLAPAAMHARPA